MSLTIDSRSILGVTLWFSTLGIYEIIDAPCYCIGQWRKSCWHRRRVLAKARGHITVMAQKPRTRRYADAWFPLLDLPIPALAERLTEFSEERVALRQCTPFAGVLTPQERWQIYRKFRKDEQYDSQ